MRGLFMLCVLALGCARSGGDPADEVMGRVQGARDRACTCKDVDCAEAIEAKLARWQDAHEARLARLPAGSRAKLASLRLEIGACLDRLRSAEAPTEPTAGPGGVDLEAPPPPEPPPEPQLPPAPGDVEPPPRVPTPAMLLPTEI